MSRCYRMEIRLGDEDNPVKEAESGILTDVVLGEWTIADEGYGAGVLWYMGDASLYGGMTADDFADRLARCVWEAAGRYVPVEVISTYLEDLPYEVHTRGEDVYHAN